VPCPAGSVQTIIVCEYKMMGQFEVERVTEPDEPKLEPLIVKLTPPLVGPLEGEKVTIDGPE